MNRFFSKLDLRDIKIDPEGSRFPPDADDDEQQPHVEAIAETTEADDEVAAAEPVDTYDPYETEVLAPVQSADTVQTEQLTAPVAANGHLAPEVVSAPLTRQGDDILKVSARSRPSAVAGAIAGVVREYGRAEVQAIGAGATNQAVKAVAIARDYLRETGIDAVCLPAFIDVTIENEDRTAIRMLIEPR